MLQRASSLLALAAAAAIASSGAHAQAATGQVVVTAPAPSMPYGPGQQPVIKHETVKYGDLNIQTMDGAKALLRRIKTAAGHVCMPMPKGGLKDAANHQNCVKGATSGAVASVDAPMLQQAYDASP